MAQSDYKNITKKKLLNGLKRLERQTPGLKIEKATKHTYKLSYTFAKRSYPLPVNHPEISKWVVENVKDWLLECEACTEEQFNQAINK